MLSRGGLGLTAVKKNGEETSGVQRMIPEDELQPCGLQVEALKGSSEGSCQQADWHPQRQMLSLMTEGSVECYCQGQLPPSPANQACLQKLEDAVLADLNLGLRAAVV